MEAVTDCIDTVIYSCSSVHEYVHILMLFREIFYQSTEEFVEGMKLSTCPTEGDYSIAGFLSTCYMSKDELSAIIQKYSLQIRLDEIPQTRQHNRFMDILFHPEIGKVNLNNLTMFEQRALLPRHPSLWITLTKIPLTWIHVKYVNPYLIRRAIQSK